MTGGSKAKTSHVFMLNWSKVDEPASGVYYPRFNFLSPQLVPPDGPDRDTYLDSVAKILIADKQGGDSYFVNKGRAALTGFMHLIVARVNEQGNYQGVPTPWVGKEASLPMLAMWLAQAQYIASKGGDDDEDWDDGGFVGPPDEAPQRPEKDPNRDVIGDWLGELCASIDPSVDGPGRSQRAFMELSPMIKMADKERSGILGTMDEAMLSFKNAAVQQRTSACDFTPDDLRGILDPAITARTRLAKTLRDRDADGKEVGAERRNPAWLDPNGPEYAGLFKDKANWKPVSLYVCINQADAKSFATITALLFECLSLSLLATGPGETNPKTLRKTGPYPVCFLLDEFAKMPKIDAVIEGPDLGRSKKISYFLIAQDYGQIEKIYGKENVRIINSTTAVKIIFAQNETETTNQVIAMAGKTTIRRASSSSEQGLHVQHLWKQNLSDQHEEVDLLRSGDVSGMPVGTHLLFVQRFNNKPMKVLTPLFFKDPEMLKHVYNMKAQKGPVADVFIPEHIKAARERREEHRR